MGTRPLTSNKPIELPGARVDGVVIWPERMEEHLRAFLEDGAPTEPVDIG